MAETTYTFDDGAAYELFMGRWSRAVGAIFLDWVHPPKGARWLDVGCGTGVFTELALETCAPAVMVAVDPAVAQIDHARGRPIGQRVEFRVADAQTLPFPDRSFDVVTSALVINFIPDRSRALTEMRRVARPGGLIAGYVWDFAGERGPNFPLRRGLQQIGIKPPIAPGTEDSRLEALDRLLDQAGLQEITTRTIDVTESFSDFNDFWRAQTPSFSPATKIIAALPEPDRARLIECVRAGLPTDPKGGIAYSARANAIKARVPG